MVPNPLPKRLVTFISIRPGGNPANESLFFYLSVCQKLQCLQHYSKAA